MDTYVPATPPSDPAQMADYLRREFQRIQTAANTQSSGIPLRYLNAAPTRPQDGIYFADGTNWNPGSGKGAYRYSSSSATYSYLG